MIFELCVETPGPCRFAREAGVARLEVCSALREDGLSPDGTLLRTAVEESGLPVHAMVRPRAGDFVYSAAELKAMAEEMEERVRLGVAGFVVGVLTPEATVDVEATRRLVEIAAGREVTFHRAFDRVGDQAAGLEAVIATGCRRVLTSGGATDVFAGRMQLAGLVQQAGNRVAVAVGGGLRVLQAAEVARVTGARQFHGTARQPGEREATAEGVRAMVAALGGARR